MTYQYCKAARAAVLLLTLLAAGGCSHDDTPTAAAVSAAVPATTDARPERVIIASRSRAEQALTERRLYAPAGDNAIEYYLALRDAAPDDASLRSALVDLQPYALIAAEQALARGDVTDAERLLALLTRMDGQAPALPRLRQELARAEDAVKARDAREATAAAKALAATQALDAASAASRAIAPTAPAPNPATDSAPPRSTVATSVPASSPAAAIVAPSPASPPRSEASPTSVPSTSTAPPPTSTSPGTARAAAMPRLLSDAPPRYPLAAMNRRMEGTVRLSFSIAPDGSVGDVQVLSASPEGVFDRAAVAAAQRWRFEAGGAAVQTTRTLRFTLPDAARTASAR